MRHLSTFLAAFILLSTAAFAQAPRTVLLEVTESTWDINTSSVVCEKESIKAMYPDDVAVISYHTDNVINGGDPLYNDVSNNWSDALGVNAFARGLIDRVSYNGTNMISVTIENWADTIAARLNRTSIGLVTMPEVLYDPATKEIYARVQIDFKKEVIELADYRFFCYILRDGLQADQLVDTNTAGCAVLPDTNDTAYNFTHMDLAFGNPGGASGVENIIPNEIGNGARFTRAFTFNVPSGVNISELRVVGFVANWGGQTSVTENNVINAAKADQFTEYDSSDESDPNHPDNADNPNSVNNPNYWPTAVEEVQIESELKFYPNPMDALGVLEFTVPTSQKVSVDVYSMDGRLAKHIYTQELSTGIQKAAISGSGLLPGLYIVHVKGTDFERFGRLIKQ